MKFFTLTFLAVFFFAATLAAIEIEDEVLVLTKDNFKEAVAENEFLLVEIYAPWCGHCKALAPEYAKAAKKLKEQGLPIALGKVDATVETELAEMHNVNGYPTLKFYRHGNAIDYSGGRKADGIISWVTKKSEPSVKVLLTVDEAKSFIDANEVAIIGFFKDPEAAGAKDIQEVSISVDEYVYGITSSEEVFNEYKAQDGKVILFKKFDEPRIEFNDELDATKLINFVSVHALPLVVEFSQDTAQKIFNGDIKSHLLVFLSKEAGHFDEYVEKLKEPAKKFRGEVLFVTINVDVSDHERILEFFGIKKDEAPAMRIIKLERQMVKYKPEKSELSSENVVEFVSAFVEGKLKRYLFEQDLPEDWDKNPVKILVASNFHEVAFDESKDVLVEFYAPWCGHCKQLTPIYEALGEKYKDKEDLVIAKMDATANELDDIKIVNYPTIILYKKKTNEGVEYGDERTLEGLSKFIESNGALGQAAEEAQEEDEDDDVPRKDEL